jgi:hypothetical protein
MLRKNRSTITEWITLITIRLDPLRIIITKLERLSRIKLCSLAPSSLAKKPTHPINRSSASIIRLINNVPRIAHLNHSSNFPSLVKPLKSKMRAHTMISNTPLNSRRNRSQARIPTPTTKRIKHNLRTLRIPQQHHLTLLTPVHITRKLSSQGFRAHHRARGIVCQCSRVHDAFLRCAWVVALD